MTSDKFNKIHNMEKGFKKKNDLMASLTSSLAICCPTVCSTSCRKGEGGRKKYIFWIFYKIFYTYIKFKFGIIIYCLTNNSHWCLVAPLWFCLLLSTCYFAQENISWTSQHHFSIIRQLILPYLCQIFTKLHRSFCYGCYEIFLIIPPF